MTTRLRDGAYNGFARIKRYLSPKRGGFFTSPRTDTCPEGWGVANTESSGGEGGGGVPPSEDPTTSLLGVCGDAKYVKRFTYNREKKQWVISNFPGDQLFGNIDWRGPLKDVPPGRQVPPAEYRDRHVLTWYGPPSRYFPCDKFSYDSDNPAHCMLYYGGGVLGILPVPILGAAFILGPDRHPHDGDEAEFDRPLSTSDITWVIVIGKSGLNTYVYSKALGDRTYRADEVYVVEGASKEERGAVIENLRVLSSGWDLIAKLGVDEFAPANEVLGTIVILDQRTPWFFSEDGASASCIREVQITFDALGLKNTQETTYRNHLSLTSNSAEIVPVDFDTPFTYTVLNSISTPGDTEIYTFLGDMECPNTNPVKCTYAEWVNTPQNHYWWNKNIQQITTLTGSRPVATDWVGNEEVLAWLMMGGEISQQLDIMRGADFAHYPPEAGAPTLNLPLINIALDTPGGLSVLAASRSDLMLSGTYDASVAESDGVTLVVEVVSGWDWLIMDRTGWVPGTGLVDVYGGAFSLPFAVKENTGPNTRVAWVTINSGVVNGNDSSHTGPMDWEGDFRCVRFFVVQAGSGETEVIPIPETLGSPNPPPFPVSSAVLDYEDTADYKYNNNGEYSGAIEQGPIRVRDDYTGDYYYRYDYIGQYRVKPTQYIFGGGMYGKLTWILPGTTSTWVSIMLALRNDSSSPGTSNGFFDVLDGVTEGTSTAVYDPPIPPEEPVPGEPAFKGRVFDADLDRYIHFLDLRDTQSVHCEKAFQRQTDYYGYNPDLSFIEEYARKDSRWDSRVSERYQLGTEPVTSDKFMEKQTPREVLVHLLGWQIQNAGYWPDNLSNIQIVESYDGSYPAVLFPYAYPDPLAFGDILGVTTTTWTSVGFTPFTIKPLYDYLGKGGDAYREGDMALSQAKDKLVSMKYTKPAPVAGDPDIIAYYSALITTGTTKFNSIPTSEADNATFRLYPLGPV